MEVLRGPRGQRVDVLTILGRALDDLVVHIGDVADVGHVTDTVLLAQQLGEYVEDHQRAGVADMDVVIDRRPADIHAHIGRIDRLEQFFLTRVSIVEMKGHHEFPGLIAECARIIRARTGPVRR